MKSINEEKKLLESIIKGLGEHFGSRCEFVLHDYSQGFTSSIVAIEHGELTGRKVGDSGTRIGLSFSHAGKENEDGRFHYITQTKDGKRLLSSTILLKDDKDEVKGSLCINMDISDLIGLKNFINEFLNDKPAETVVYNDVEDILAEMIRESVDAVGVSVSDMTREQKIEGIQYLNQRGAFRIKNAANIVARYYDISKYTVYNYINDSDKLR